jgi:hypothetical protein
VRCGSIHSSTFIWSPLARVPCRTRAGLHLKLVYCIRTITVQKFLLRLSIVITSLFLLLCTLTILPPRLSSHKTHAPKRVSAVLSLSLCPLVFPLLFRYPLFFSRSKAGAINRQPPQTQPFTFRNHCNYRLGGYKIPRLLSNTYVTANIRSLNCFCLNSFLHHLQKPRDMLPSASV